MELNLGETPLDLDFHPSAPLVAAGLVNGYLHLYRYADDSQPERLLKIRAHKKNNSSRAVRFIDAGCAILTGSSDCSIVVTDVETGVAVKQVQKAHGDTVNRIVSLTENTVASGDDEGCIKIWDTRDWTCCNSFDAHEDYISDMTFVSDSMQLLGTSGDGTLSVCSLRKNKVGRLTSPCRVAHERRSMEDLVRLQFAHICEAPCYDAQLFECIHNLPNCCCIFNLPERGGGGLVGQGTTYGMVTENRRMGRTSQEVGRQMSTVLARARSWMVTSLDGLNSGVFSTKQPELGHMPRSSGQSESLVGRKEFQDILGSTFELISSGDHEVGIPVRDFS